MATLLVCLIFSRFHSLFDFRSDLQNFSALHYTSRNIRGAQRYPTPPTVFSAPGCAYYHRW